MKYAPLTNQTTSTVLEPTYELQVLHTEVIKSGEISGLLERGALEIVLRSKAGENPDDVPSSFVLAIKHKHDGTTKYKVRFVIGGHRDRDKHFLVHDSATVRAQSVRLLLALGTIFGLRISVADWTQGYVQSKSHLKREIFTRPKELELNQNELV